MPKRTAHEKLQHYKRKIQKLEQEQKDFGKNRRRIRCLDSSDDENTTDTIVTKPQNTTESQAGPLDNETIPESMEQEVGSVPDPMDDVTTPAVTGQDATGPSPIATMEVNLDPELLSALGVSTSDTPEFGDNIHESLASLWTPVLKKGLPKEHKDKLTKEYLVPGNCKLLQAPKLNAEISAAVADIVRGRDKKLVSFQQQLGTGVVAINKAMDTLLTSDNKVQALKYLSDGCRVLSDLHHLFTKDRTKLITPSLEKNFLHVIQDTERDDTLFGNALSEKIKASKAIERQGSQIRKVTTNLKTASIPSTVTRPAPLGNWSGPPRYPSNRGGRGGQRKPAPTPIRRTYPPTQPQAKSFNQPRYRAPAPQ